MPEVPWQLPLVASGSPDATFTAGQAGAANSRPVPPGGGRIRTHAEPGGRAVTRGVWVPVGSRDESRAAHGSTHFLEHLLFKGTTARSAATIAEAFDEVGGESNAATSKEHTCYYARVLDEDLPMAVAVLTDMVTDPLLDPDAFDTERQVILEELAMNEDDAADLAHEEFLSRALRPVDLARPIGGTREAIAAVTRSEVWDHYRAHYRPENLVVTAAGGVDHDRLCEMVLTGLAAGGWALPADARPAARRGGPRPHEALEATTWAHERPGEQSHVVVGTSGIHASDERRFVMTMLCTILGGGMSSRLFQEVRERRGLAYSTYAFASSYSDDGAFGMYAGCAPRSVGEVADVMHAELRRLAAGDLDDRELARAQGQLTGGLVLGLEDTASRMSRLGRAEISLGELYSIDESLAALRAVRLRDVIELASDLASAPTIQVVVGARVV